MTDNEHRAYKNKPTESGTADPAEGRESQDSPIESISKGCTGDGPPTGDQSAGDTQECSGQTATNAAQILADGGQVMPEAAASILASTYRMTVVAALSDGAATPSTIADEQDVGIAHVSRALQKLRGQGVVELLVDDDVKRGRVYGLTDEGRDLLNEWGEVIERNSDSELGRGDL